MVKKNQFLWYRCALYIIYILMRIRNLKTSVWWAMYNAASYYGHGGSNLPVFFGISVSQTYFLCNLDTVNKYDSITMKLINSMRYMEFVIGSFDYS